MFPPYQFTGRGQSSQEAPPVPPALPGINPVIRPTSSASIPYGQLPGVPGGPPISLTMKQFQPAVERRMTDVAGSVDLHPSSEISYDKFDEDNQSNNSSDLGRAKGNAPISLKQTQFSLKEFPKGKGQPNFCAFNKRKKGWVAGFLQKKYRSIFLGQNRLNQQQSGPLNWEMAGAEFVESFKTWLPLENFNNAECIW